MSQKNFLTLIIHRLCTVYALAKVFPRGIFCLFRDFVHIYSFSGSFYAENIKIRLSASYTPHPYLYTAGGAFGDSALSNTLNHIGV